MPDVLKKISVKSFCTSFVSDSKYTQICLQVRLLLLNIIPVFVTIQIETMAIYKLSNY